MNDGERRPRVFFYGSIDLFGDDARVRAFDLLRTQWGSPSLLSLNDAIELEHALKFLEHEAYPSTCGTQERHAFAALRIPLERAVNDYVRGLDASTFAEALVGLEPEYSSNAIGLILRHRKSFEVSRAETLHALTRAGVPVSVLLESKKFVREYAGPLTALLLEDPLYADFWIQKRLVAGGAPSVHLPDMKVELVQGWLRKYIAHADAHINSIQMIVEAPNQEKVIVDKKVRLEATRRYEMLADELLNSEGVVVSHTYTSVTLDPETNRRAWLKYADDGAIVLHVGEKHLRRTFDFSSILDNFESVFCFTEQSQLWMPSYKAELGVFQVFRMEGKHSYPRSAVFHRKDNLTIMGLAQYRSFLESNGILLEEVIAWFFNDHLREMYGAEGFQFQPPSVNSTWVEKIRHLTAETEGIAGQFALYCEEGEIDRDLFEIESGSFQWSTVPSLTQNKYYLEDPGSDCWKLAGLLFSNQSGLAYINEELQADSFAELVTSADVELDSANSFLRARMQPLIEYGLLGVADGILDFPEPTQILVLHDLYSKEAVPVGAYSTPIAEAAHGLYQKGLLLQSSFLLSPAESRYFEFWMNKNVYSDGPDLRNKYTHGNGPAPDETEAHRLDYYYLLRILVALVLKIRNDFRDYRAGQDS